ncbi:MAG: sigma-70 family RNA polymerase sigma factor [Lachnospiraceae bacterium]|nr:sigma-70 family RNA polymerase sigma factor [Lachnospiraceae bacterium]
MNEKFRILSDEELISKFRGGDNSAADFLMEKYKYLVKLRAKSLYLLGGDRDDLIQEGMIGLYRAICDFDASKEASFETFASLVVSRQIYAAVRTASRKKHFPLNDAMSIEEDENAQTSEFVNRDYDPESLYIDGENLERIEKQIHESLSDFEQYVLERYLNGMTYGEIAELTGRDEKSIYNAVGRIRSKLKRFMT